MLESPSSVHTPTAPDRHLLGEIWSFCEQGAARLRRAVGVSHPSSWNESSFTSLVCPAAWVEIPSTFLGQEGHHCYKGTSGAMGRNGPWITGWNKEGGQDSVNGCHVSSVWFWNKWKFKHRIHNNLRTVSGYQCHCSCSLKGKFQTKYQDHSLCLTFLGSTAGLSTLNTSRMCHFPTILRFMGGWSSHDGKLPLLAQEFLGAFSSRLALSFIRLM